MLFSLLLASLKRTSEVHPERPRRPGKAYRSPAAPWRCFVPRPEVLEDRTMPSTLTVLNNADSGAGSLRATVAAAGSGDTITFAASLKNKTITLTSGQLVLNKNLDIEGLGA